MEVSKTLGDTELGLTGREIAAIVAACGLPDPGAITKRDRLFYAMEQGQEAEGSGAPVVRIVQEALDPVRYTANRTLFDDRRNDLNVTLAFAGMQIREDGKLVTVPPAATLSEAHKRASRLRSELVRRGIPNDVLKFCRPELLEANYFHAVFEATKSVAQKVRDLTGSMEDGQALVEDALGIRNGRTPLLAWNQLSSDNDRSEHRGVALMISGTFAYFRNLPAHVPKIGFRTITEDEALEILTILSFLHRRLDAAVATHVNPTRQRP